MLTREALARFAPRPAKATTGAIWDGYMAALTSEATAKALEQALFNQERLRHFLAQCAHECGGFTILWEDMNYRAERIMEIFGVGKHSARVTRAEAAGLAHNPEKLAERVYGLGNPKKAAELGNVDPGDGYNCRGFGIQQITGRRDHDRLLSGDHSFQAAVNAALVEWIEKGCNELADIGDLDTITRRINGGFNGLADRRRWYARAISVWPDAATYQVAKAGLATLRMGDTGPSVTRLQELLVSRGYFLGRVDGEFGQRVADAVLLFQSHHGLQLDGQAGPLTFAALEQAPPREERQGVSATTMAQQGDPTVNLTQRFKALIEYLATFLGLGTALQAGGIAMVEAIITKAEAVMGLMQRATGLLGKVPIGALMAASGVGVVLGLVWLIAHAVEKRHVAAARKGAFLGA